MRKLNEQITKQYFMQSGLPEPVFELQYIPGRKFRLDIAWQDWKVGIEVQGGTYGRGKRCPYCGERKAMGHSSITGMIRDREKNNLGILAGWRVFQVDTRQLYTIETVNLVKGFIKEIK